MSAYRSSTSVLFANVIVLREDSSYKYLFRLFGLNKEWPTDRNEIGMPNVAYAWPVREMKVVRDQSAQGNWARTCGG